MTDEEIEKGLKNPWYDGEYHYVMHCDVLDYINRLKAEKYQLEQNLGQCENGYRLELLTAKSQIHSAKQDKNYIAIDLLHTFEIQMHNKFGIEEDDIKSLIREIKQAVKEKYDLEI